MDAAKLACSPGALDLRSCCADFTVVSFYKIFGYPTGLGALLVRHDAAPLLQPAEATYFAGVWLRKWAWKYQALSIQGG